MFDGDTVTGSMFVLSIILTTYFSHTPIFENAIQIVKMDDVQACPLKIFRRFIVPRSGGRFDNI